jgi:hypothetical protein
MERMRFGVILNRHAAQVVQSGFIGEMSTAITLNPWAPFLLQFRSYPLLAAEKQQARNLKFADKEAATGIFLNTISSATSRIIRAYSLASAMPDNTEEERKKKERFLESKFSYEQFAFDTFTYMGTSGMIPEIMGYSEQFGVMDFNGVTGGGRRESIGDSIPAINFADNYMQAIDSALNVGDMSDQDYRNIQNVMPLGTIKYMNLIWGELRDAASSLRDEVPAT